jgi:NAD(P)-dependent dehydrogenase (short-subunit alcohol dehydrogenase family)
MEQRLIAMLLFNKVIIVTGGASGIGYECAKAYEREGAQVAVLDIQPADQLIAEIGNRHLGLLCDITDEVRVAGAIEQVAAHFGHIDGMHNNAGIASPSKTLHETTTAEWHSLMNVNLLSIYITTKYALPHLIKSKGSILNTSSMVGSIGQEQHAAYAATKGAVNALTKSMAIDYAKYGIRVNAVAPAGVWTPTLKQWAKEQPNQEGIEQYLDDIHRLGYCPEGDVVADACTFLLSEKARFITGCIMPVSGGAELGYRC